MPTKKERMSALKGDPTDKDKKKQKRLKDTELERRKKRLASGKDYTMEKATPIKVKKVQIPYKRKGLAGGRKKGIGRLPAKDTSVLPGEYNPKTDQKQPF